MRNIRKFVVFAGAVSAAVLAIPASAIAAPPGSPALYTPDYGYASDSTIVDASGTNSAESDASRSGLLQTSASASCTAAPVCTSANDGFAQAYGRVGEVYHAKNNTPQTIKAIATFSVTESALSGGLGSQGNQLGVLLSSYQDSHTCRTDAPLVTSDAAPATVVIECTFTDPNGGFVGVYGTALSYTYDNTGDSAAQTASMAASLVSLEVSVQQ